MNTFLESVVTNDVMALFLLFIAALPAILCIVLFFKVWGMTNDVSKIKDRLALNNTVQLRIQLVKTPLVKNVVLRELHTFKQTLSVWRTIFHSLPFNKFS